MRVKSVDFCPWAWHPPQSYLTSPGRSWCQVWDEFSTIPRLSMVWKVKGESAGIFAKKLVSGFPSGSRGCLPFSSNFRTGISPNTRSLSLA